MKIAIIGGTGLQKMEGVTALAQHHVETDYGTPSSPIEEMRLSSTDVENSLFFLARHGLDQQIPPHLINYRANIRALCDLGVTSVLAVTAVGGVKEGMALGDLAVPDQLIDYSWGRESTYFDGVRCGRRHIDFTYPYTQSLRDALINAGNSLEPTNSLERINSLEPVNSSQGRKLHAGGVYGCTQGPRLETAAEVLKLRSDGVDLVGMTGMPEAALARELTMDYACLSLVVNPAAGLSGVELSEHEIEQECHRAGTDICQLLARAVSELNLSDSGA